MPWKAIGWFFVLVGFSSYCVFEFWVKPLPDISNVKTKYPYFAWSVKSQKQEVKWSDDKPGAWVRSEQISSYAQEAIRMSEDANFYQHKGVDLREVKESIKKNLREKRYARGASTITQQVARTLFLSSEKNLRRKVREIFLARRIERAISKKKIFEIYANIAPWGSGIIGIAQASRVFFEKPPSQLSPKEGAFLAMLLPSPHRYAQSYREQKLTEYARKTIESILLRMKNANVMTIDEYELERSSPLAFEVEKPQDENFKSEIQN